MVSENKPVSEFDQKYTRFNKFQQDFITREFFDNERPVAKIAALLRVEINAVYKFIKLYKSLDGFRYVNFLKRKDDAKQLRQKTAQLAKQVHPTLGKGNRKLPLIHPGLNECSDGAPSLSLDDEDVDEGNDTQDD